MSLTFISYDYSQAECFDDSECGSGLMCYKRDGSEDVPGCSGEENSDLNTEDVCVTPCTQDYCVLHDIGNGINPGTGYYGKCEVSKNQHSKI